VIHTIIKYTNSAFKHGFFEEDIKKSFLNVIYDDILNEYENKHLLIGFNGKGILLEIMYNVIDNETIRVFHAMECRKSFITLFDSLV